MAYGTINADVIGTSVANTSLGAGNASIMKNRIINGAMTVAQYGTGSTTVTSNGYYSCDRWKTVSSASSKYAVQQSSFAPSGFSNSLQITSASAYSIGAGDFFGVLQRIEGFNTYDLAWGTASAKAVTLSFWVQSSLTGTFGGVLTNSAESYSYPYTYTIPIANTWTQISVTIAGPTTGTWVGATNGIGIELWFGLGVGSTYSGTAGSWSANQYFSATGATSVVGTNGATFYITGVQLEVGSSATGFEYRQYGQELALCQRYYYLHVSGNNQAFANSAVYGSNEIDGIINFKTTMRTAPSLVMTTGASYYLNNAYAGANISSFTIYNATTNSTMIYASVAPGVTNGTAGTFFTQNAAASVAFNSEL